MRFRLEIERPRFAPAADDDVVGGSFPDRDAGMRNVRQRLEQHRALALGAIELDLELLDLLGAQLARFEQVRDVFTLPLGARDLIARRVLLALEALDLGDQALPVGFGCCQLLQLARHAQAAIGHGASAPLPYFR